MTDKAKAKRLNTLNKRKQRFADQVRKLLLREMRNWNLKDGEKNADRNHN